MKLQKIPVIHHGVISENQSGEVEYGWSDSGRMLIGRVAPGSSSEIFSADRNGTEDVLSVYCEGIIDWVSSKDRIIVDGVTWNVVGRPTIWRNRRGYRSVTIINARNVEG